MFFFHEGQPDLPPDPTRNMTGIPEKQADKNSSLLNTHPPFLKFIRLPLKSQKKINLERQDQEAT
jgi:hypothetical protein